MKGIKGKWLRVKFWDNDYFNSGQFTAEIIYDMWRFANNFPTEITDELKANIQQLWWLNDYFCTLPEQYHPDLSHFNLLELEFVTELPEWDNGESFFIPLWDDDETYITWR